MLGFNGGLLGVRKVPTTGNATGLWMPNEQSVAQRAGIWPPFDDPDWSNVRLYLPFTGLNNRIIFNDVSGDIRTITRVGSPVTSTARYPFSGGGSSGLFQADGDYLETTLASAIGTGNWTAEVFLYATTLVRSILVFCFDNYYLSTGLLIGVNSSGALFAFSDLGGTNLATTTAITTNTWYYLAWVKSGSTLTMYINGVSGGSGTYTGNLSSTTLRIGANSYNTAHAFGGGYITGNLSHARLTAAARTISSTPTAPFPFQ